MANNNKRKQPKKGNNGGGNQSRPKQQQPKPRRQRRRNANPNRPSTSTAIVSQNRVITNKASALRSPVRGSDLLMSTVIPSTASAGDVMVDIIIAPEAFTRMKALASAFQRVRYHKMKFDIQTSASTLTAGTYDVAFVADATDQPPVLGADRWIAAQGDAKNSSYWQPVTVDMPPSVDDLYTSPQANELRWSSPGRLVLVVITPPTSDVPLSIFCDWSVSFHTPSIEPTLESTVDLVYTSKVPFAMVQNATADTAIEQLFKVRETGTRLMTLDDFSPPLPTGVYLQIPDGPITIVANTGASGAPMSMTATHIGSLLDGSDLGIAYYTYLEQSQSFQLSSSRSTPPMSVAPSAVPEYYSGTIFEVAPQSLDLSQPASTSFLQRSRRSLKSAPIRLVKLPSGRIVSFQGLTKL